MNKRLEYYKNFIDDLVEIQPTVLKKWVMEKAEEKDKYTIVEYKTLTFKKSLPARLFTLSNLMNPRR